MRALLCHLVLSTLLSCAATQAEGLSREQALKLGADNDGAGNGKFWSENGDASPPFVHAGYVTLSTGNQLSLSLNAETTQGLGVDASFSDGSETRLDFFTSAKGKGWSVAHVLKPEVQIAKKLKTDDRSPTHVALCSAAELAIAQRDIEFLRLLLKKGLNVEQFITLEERETLLHLACARGEVEMVKFLLAQGAPADARSRYGDRPIDVALKTNHHELCKLLVKPEGKEVIVDGIPEGIITQLIEPTEDEVVFVSLNGKDPSAEMLKMFTLHVPRARVISGMMTLDRRPLGAPSWYQDSITKEFGSLVEISLEKPKEEWNVRVRHSVGPVMAGGGWSGTVQKLYGYWCVERRNGWEE